MPIAQYQRHCDGEAERESAQDNREEADPRTGYRENGARNPRQTQILVVRAEAPGHQAVADGGHAHRHHHGDEHLHAGRAAQREQVHQRRCHGGGDDRHDHGDVSGQRVIRLQLRDHVSGQQHEFPVREIERPCRTEGKDHAERDQRVSAAQPQAICQEGQSR
jgi:hypothetical protein